MKTLIAIPCFDHVPAKFCASLAMLKHVGSCRIAMQPGSLIYTARQTLAAFATSLGTDYIAWFDSDMVFPPDTLERLFDTMDRTGADMVTGLYFRRVPPYSPVLFDKLDIDPETGSCAWSGPEEIPAEPFEVAACGFGCVLMKTDVCRAVQVEFDSMFAPIANNGEDIAFCWRARQCGYKIICDPAIELGHVGQIAVNRAFYENIRRGSNGNRKPD